MLTGLPRYAWNCSRNLLRIPRPNASPDNLPPPASPLHPSAEFWALKDINFEIKQGEVVGIIGRNGAGKSTLLKILSRITEPTSGRFGIRGRVASLLEVGTGFHPELTGRENIYVSGITLGMTRAEIKQRFDEIVEFSGVEKFLDTPVKHYSSGMQVRLGFAVAAHLESEILIIDEVLAVGDAEFQRKSSMKLRQLSEEHQRTVLFVSHQLNAVAQLARRCLLLNSGELILDSEVKDTINYYGRARGNLDTSVAELEHHQNRRRKSKSVLRKIELLTEGLEPLESIAPGASFIVRLSYFVDVPATSPVFGLSIVNGQGVRVLASNNRIAKSSLRTEIGSVGAVTCRIESFPLCDGEYSISLCFSADGIKDIDEIDDVLSIRVDSQRIGVTQDLRDYGLLSINTCWQPA